MSQRVKEALTAGGPTSKDKGAPVPDGVLSVTPDTPEAIEWRSRRSVIDSIASSSTYLDDEEEGPRSSDLYGKFTWKIEKFSEVSKRELRSHTFEVGTFKWYILVYPQGCDVANHLSLFLCVADYDKLLPGWAHFAQFTIAVVNKDPKKSKYSDTLHRFCKKEHDWGWKKFMELGKVVDGFTVADTLVIKAQVQVIRDRPYRPFRCLDAQYRRELVRVYLTNVEGIARRFIEEKRAYLASLIDPGRGFAAYWHGLPAAQRAELACDSAASVFKGLVKRFFNEKEVTSTLVMDALYCGAKTLEEAGRRHLESEDGEEEEAAGVLIDAERNQFFFARDVVEVLERALADVIPPFTPDKPGDALALRNGQGDEYSRDIVERDERRLADLGRRAVEMFAAAHIASTRLEAAWAEAEVIKRQDALILEEELRERQEAERDAQRAEADREKRARKKERQKKKKEAERAKREAEEAERAAQEEARRVEQLRRQAEAEEKRRKEEAEREQELLRQRAAAKQAAEARKQQEAAAKRAKQAAEKAARQQAAAAEKASAAAAAAAGEAAVGSSEDDPAPAEPGRPSSAASEASGGLAGGLHSRTASESSDLGAASTQGGSSLAASGPASLSASAASSRAATPEASSLAAAAVAAAVQRAQQQRPGSGSDTPASLQLAEAAGGTGGAASSAAPTSSSGSGGSSEMSSEDQVEALRQHVAHLEQQLSFKDDQIAALKARVALLESELGIQPELSGAGACSSGSASAPSSRPPSAASTHQRSASASAELPLLPSKPANGLENGHLAAAASSSATGKAATAPAAALGLPPGSAAAAAPRLPPSGLPANSPSGAILASATASMSAALQQQEAGAASAGHLRRPASQQGHASVRPATQLPVLRQSSAPVIGGGRSGGPAAGPASRHVPGVPGMPPQAGSQFAPGGLPAPYSKAALAGVGAAAAKAQPQRMGYAAAAAGNGQADGNGAGAGASYRNAAALGSATLGHSMASLGSMGSSSGSASDGLPASTASLLANGSRQDSGSMYAAAASGMLQQGAASRGYSSPLPSAAKASPLGALDSPGLEEYLHMGLITDLLE